MSVEVMSLVFKCNMPELKTDDGKNVPDSTAKFVLLSLADHSNEEGEGAYPGVDKICQKTNFSTSTVCNALNALRHNGFTTLEGKSKSDTNNYTISVAKIREFQWPKPGDSSHRNPSVSAARTKPLINHQVNHPSEGENSTSEAIKAANKTVDVLFAMQREADARKTYMHRERMPDAIRDLMDVFWEEYGINCISHSDWIATGTEWLSLGATPASVRTACERSRPDANGRGGLTNVTRPGSITGLVNAVVGERNKGSGGSDLLSFIRSYKEKNG